MRRGVASLLAAWLAAAPPAVVAAAPAAGPGNPAAPGQPAPAAAPAPASADPMQAVPGRAAFPPLVRAEAVERHRPDTLWERIDGEAELYKAHGLVSSAHALFADPADPDRRVDLSVFLVREALGAFGLFAGFRPPECFPVQPLGSGGCLGEFQGFFWQGPFFVLADASGPAAGRAADLRRVLEGAASLLGPPPPRPASLRAFSRHIDTRTIRYQPAHLLGREALPPGLEGEQGGVAYLLSGATCEVEPVLAGYARVLEGAVRFERDGYKGLAGRDPLLGPVTLAGS